MRILHLIPSLGGGGAERQVGALAEGSRRLGCEIHVGIVTKGVHFDRIVRAGATVHHIAARGNHDPRLPSRVARLILNVKPDIVQTWLTQMDVVGGVAAIVTRVPWILSERTTAMAYEPSLKNRLRRWLGGFASAIVANSLGGAEYWAGVGAGRVFVVPNALPIAEIAAAVPAEEFDASAPLILFVGRFDTEKNIPSLIEAAVRVLKNRDATVVLCGDGPLERMVRTRIEQSGVSDQFRLLGFSDRVWSLMKRADVMVAPSWFEGQPNAVMEAAVCGCPLVLSDIPAHRECIGEGGALYADPRDPAALAEMIERALDDREAAMVRARHARAIAEQRTIERATASYFEVYEKVAN